MLDIRIPIGLMFSILGVILAAYGVMTRGTQIYHIHSLGVNVNMYWGCVLLIFGLFMLTMAYMTRERSKKQD